MKTADQTFWQALSEAGDYFSRMGGSGRYQGFSEYHVPALILISVLESSKVTNGNLREIKSLLPREMWESTNDLPNKILGIVSNASLDESNILKNYIEMIRNKYQKVDPQEADKWDSFLVRLEAAGWRI